MDPDLPRLDDPTDLDAHDFLALAIDDVGERWAGDAQAGETWPPGIASDVWPLRLRVSLTEGLPLVLRGQVRDASRGGAPLEGVRVAAVYCSHRCSAPVRTDADGAYELSCEGVGPFQRIHVRAWRPDLGIWDSPPTQVLGRTSIEYDFEIVTQRLFLPRLCRAAEREP